MGLIFVGSISGNLIEGCPWCDNEKVKLGNVWMVFGRVGLEMD